MLFTHAAARRQLLLPESFEKLPTSVCTTSLSYREYREVLSPGPLSLPLSILPAALFYVDHTADRWSDGK
jgi:hypothetical protein